MRIGIVGTLNRIPVGRRFSDTLHISPGVSSSGGAGSANPSVSGASGLENLYVVDGINITNQGYGALGSYSIVFGSLGNGTPYDFIKEIDVKTGGFEAEFGQTTGGVINVITKSGSNALRGSVFGYTRPDALEAAFTQIQTPNGTVNTIGTQAGDAGIEVGGSAVRDRLFWFAAVDPQWSRRTFIAPDGFPLRSLGEVDRNRTIISYAGKALGRSPTSTGLTPRSSVTRHREAAGRSASAPSCARQPQGSAKSTGSAGITRSSSTTVPSRPDGFWTPRGDERPTRSARFRL